MGHEKQGSPHTWIWAVCPGRAESSLWAETNVRDEFLINDNYTVDLHFVCHTHVELVGAVMWGFSSEP